MAQKNKELSAYEKELRSFVNAAFGAVVGHKSTLNFSILKGRGIFLLFLLKNTRPPRARKARK